MTRQEMESRRMKAVERRRASRQRQPYETLPAVTLAGPPTGVFIRRI